MEGMPLTAEDFEMLKAIKAGADIGLSMSAAFTIFAKKWAERRIPFEISAELFYSDSNMNHLSRGVVFYRKMV